MHIKVAIPHYSARSLVSSSSSVRGSSTTSGHGTVTWHRWRTYSLGGSVLALPPATVGTHYNSWW